MSLQKFKAAKLGTLQTVTNKTTILMENASKSVLPADAFLTKGLVDEKPVLFSFSEVKRKEQHNQPRYCFSFVWDQKETITAKRLSKRPKYPTGGQYRPRENKTKLQFVNQV